MYTIGANEDSDDVYRRQLLMSDAVTCPLSPSTVSPLEYNVVTGMKMGYFTSITLSLTSERVIVRLGYK